jgi:hypothetical protein
MQIAAAIFAGLAAVLWFSASLVSMPPTDLDKLALRDMGKISDSF